jgi:hypothetical protein
MDLAKDSRKNLEIQAFNAKLSKTVKSFRHVTLDEMDFNRKYLLDTACTEIMLEKSGLQN